jgi:hypothetical protein
MKGNFLKRRDAPNPLRIETAINQPRLPKVSRQREAIEMRRCSS